MRMAAALMVVLAGCGGKKTKPALFRDAELESGLNFTHFSGASAAARLGAVAANPITLREGTGSRSCKINVNNRIKLTYAGLTHLMPGAYK
jgi:hypothetical protein